MKARIIGASGALLLVLAAAPTLAIADQGGPLSQLKHDYLEGLFKAKPHLATFMGEHRHDDKLPDYSPEAVAARAKELTDQQKAVRPFVRNGKKRVQLSTDDQIDADILDDGIALELMYLRDLHEWTHDPRLHDSFPYYDPREIIAGRLSDIIHGDYAPEPQRRKAVVGQLRALPAFVEQYRTQLKTPARVLTETAISDNHGRIEFFNTEVKDFFKGDPEGEKARAAAVDALTRYQTFLEKDLLPRSTGDWRLGATLYRKKFPLALQTTYTPTEVIPKAEAAFARARRELYEVAIKLHEKLWPKEPAPSEKADNKTQAAVIARVKEELSKDHPSAAPGELVKAHAAKLEGLRAFIEKNDLLALPPKESLSVKEMPAFKRGAAGAEYLAPGILEDKKEWRATYYVDPVDPAWPKEKIDSYLKGQNDYSVELTAAHEAYPGHHTQFFYEKKKLEPLRAVLWNGAMVEGWACYAESLLVHLGYGGERNLAFRFQDLLGDLVIATNILLDIKLQSGLMSDEEALKFMEEDGFQEKAVAEKKLLRAKLDSTQLAQYFLGYTEIKELEQEARTKGSAQAKKFNQRAFDEAMIGYGSIAVKHLRSYLLGP